MIKRQRGLNLIEVLIAAFLISIGLLGMAGLQVKSFKVTHNSYQMQQASQLAYELLERMRANREAVLAGDYNLTAMTASTACPHFTLDVNCQAASCTQSQMAQDDIYRVLCGYGENNGIASLLMNGTLAIECPAGATACDQGVRLSMSWSERNSNKEAGSDVESFSLIMNALL